MSKIKDVDRLILDRVVDKELLIVCQIDKRFWYDVCDDSYLRRRLQKYPTVEKYKRQNESWKQFFLRFVYYFEKMKKEYQFDYISGNFKKQYEILLEHGRMRDLLVEAASSGELNLVIYAQLRCADIYAYEDALTSACQNGHFEIVKYLVETAKVDRYRSGELKAASQHGHFEIVKYLVEHGADVRIDDNEPLIMAAQAGHFEIVKYLVEQGADIHTGNESPLLVAAANGHVEVVEYLVQRCRYLCGRR